MGEKTAPVAISQSTFIHYGSKEIVQYSNLNAIWRSSDLQVVLRC
jgi:hypothetical protein